jgi:LysR family transcriptional regulator for metE and metH
MEMRHLRLVRTLAVEGTLTAAGKKLFLSQSALSHQLREIEDELGVQLFQRANKRMVLTAAGQRVLSSADVVLEEIKDVRQDILRMSNGETGTLRVAACRCAGFHWLPTVLKPFMKSYPGVEVCIDTAPSHDPIGLLVANSVDIAIVNFKDEHKGVTYLKLFDDQMVVVAKSDHPWANREHVSARDFSGDHLITYDLPFEEMEFNRKVLVPAGVEPASLTRVPTTDAIIELVKAGIGVAVLNLWSIQPYLESEDLATVPLKKNGFSRSWYAAVNDDHRKPPYIARFIGFLANSQN